MTGLFGRAADRDREDFEREVMPHLTEIYRAALRSTRNPAEAEDVAQEVFLQAWKSFARYERGTNGRAWLYRILWNVTQQLRRKKQAIPLGAEGEAVMAETLAAPEPTPEKITDDEVARALAALSAEHREIVLLSDVEGFTYKEIAGMLSVPVGTVMSRLSRARAALRRRLSGMAVKIGIVSEALS
jgi:RNA polymerase sigma-70 factor (ECF subfamily)